MTQSARLPAAKRGKILYLLLFALTVTGFLPVMFVAQKLIGLYQEELRSTLREKQLTQAPAISEALDTYVDGARARVAKIAEAFSVLAELPGDDPTPRLLGDPGFLKRFLDADLILLTVHTRGGKRFESQTDPRISPEQVERLLAGGLATGQELISQPTYLPEREQAVVVITRPILSGTAVAGVLSGVFALNPIWDGILHELNVPYTAFVLDREGALIAHTDPAAMRKPAPRNELIDRFLGAGARDKETIPFTIAGPSGDVRMLGTRVPTRNGWGVFVQVEEGLAFAPAAAMKRAALRWALLTLLLGIGVAVLFAGYVTRPIQRLAEASRAFARGELGRRVEVSANNEIGELADTFNLMSTEIQGYIERLKSAAEENHELFLGTIRVLATAIDEKDPYTRGHSERVNRLSLVIGKHLDLSEKEMRHLHIASLLHDVGKIGIDDRILRKPAALTDDEFEVMKQHPVRGANILSGVRALEEIIPGMKHHHERWSGGGYPDGLVGEQIPLAARIIQIADSYDAMTTNRPYQRAMRMEAAVARINELTGAICDPKVVAAFNRAYRSGDLKAEGLAPGAPTARAIRENTRPANAPS